MCRCAAAAERRGVAIPLINVNRRSRRRHFWGRWRLLQSRGASVLRDAWCTKRFNARGSLMTEGARQRRSASLSLSHLVTGHDGGTSSSAGVGAWCAWVRRRGTRGTRGRYVGVTRVSGSAAATCCCTVRRREPIRSRAVRERTRNRNNVYCRLGRARDRPARTKRRRFFRFLLSPPALHILLLIDIVPTAQLLRSSETRPT